MKNVYSRRQVLIGAGLAGLASTSVAGCTLFTSENTGATEGATQLQMLWWGGDTRNAATNEALKVVEGKLPGVTIGGNSTSFDGYWTKLASQVAAASPPDLIQMSIDYLAEYAGRDALVDLKQYPADQLDLADVSEASLARATVNGKLFAIPFGIAAQCLVYDTAALEAAKVTDRLTADWTWDDLGEVAQAAAAALKDGKLGTAQFGVQDFSGQIYLAEVWLRQHGHEIYGKDLKSLGFPKEALVEWFDYWAKLRKSGAATTAAATQATLATTAEATGVAAIQSASANQLISYQSTTKHPLDITLVPSTPGGTPGRYTEATMYLSVAAKSKHLAESIKVANLLINDPEVGAKLGMERGVPVSSEVATLVAASANEQNKRTIEYVQQVKENSQDAPPLGPKGAGTVTAALQREAQEAAFGRKTSQQAVDAFFDAASKALV